MASQRLSEKVAIVTGGGRGLGRAMVLGLARAGVKAVAAVARTLAEVESVAREAGEDRVLPLGADVTRPEDCKRVVDAACRRFGGLRLLVNNAGRGMKYISANVLTRSTWRGGRSPSNSFRFRPHIHAMTRQGLSQNGGGACEACNNRS